MSSSRNSVTLETISCVVVDYVYSYLFSDDSTTSVRGVTETSIFIVCIIHVQCSCTEGGTMCMNYAYFVKEGWLNDVSLSM